MPYAVAKVVFLHGGSQDHSKVLQTWQEVREYIVDHEIEHTCECKPGESCEEHEYVEEMKTKLLREMEEETDFVDTCHIFDHDYYHGWVIISLD